MFWLNGDRGAHVARRRATIEAQGRTWQAAPAGFWKRNVIATDAAGGTVAEFEPRRPPGRPPSARPARPAA
jgi:hypothetical protein